MLSIRRILTIMVTVLDLYLLTYTLHNPYILSNLGCMKNNRLRKISKIWGVLKIGDVDISE